MQIKGNIVDIERREIYFGSITVEEASITAIERTGDEMPQAEYILSGFIDAHVHIESSQLTPAAFGRAVVARGTVGVVTDPHEIANVMGCEGVEYMIESAKSSPIRTHFTIPSAVPATPFDRSGGVITATDIERFAASGRFVALSEMMNVPGVIYNDKEVTAKIAAAKSHELPIDGHAPLLTGKDLATYASAGITTDHECSTLEEAQEKISHGMKIQIREGSAAKNYEALQSLIATAPHALLFCTDDSHPDEILSSGDIDKIVRRAVADGYDIFDVLRIASINPIEHYKLPQGRLQVDSIADFIVVDNLRDFTTQRVYINGELRYDISSPNCEELPAAKIINNFHHDKVELSQLSKALNGDTIDIIGIIPNEIITTKESYTPASATDNLESDIEADVAKIVYINRYLNTPPVVAYCKGFGLKKGAIASSIAHDSHNITAIGVSDADIASAINSIIESQGGAVICNAEEHYKLPLPIAGIISDQSAEDVAQANRELDRQVAELGSPLHSPFMTLSFLSLVVIPELKIGEEGLFSYSKFGWL